MNSVHQPKIKCFRCLRQQITEMAETEAAAASAAVFCIKTKQNKKKENLKNNDNS